ncbi:MAG: DUF3048 domain-containing protein [Acidimicrobiia bacterium]
MSRWAQVTGWVRRNPWGSAAGGLGMLLVVGLGLWLGLRGDGVAPPATAATTQPAASATTQATLPGGTVPGGPSTTQAPPSGEALDLLTGAPGQAGTVLAVKVDNAPDARPQVGLNQAGLLVEVPVEGGLTRFTAFYSGGDLPPLVGPVRSLRPVDAALLAPFSPVVAATGGQPFVVGEVEAAGAVLVDQDNSRAYQQLVRPAPHNVFVGPELALEEVPGSPPALAPLPFGGGEPSGSGASTIHIPYSSSSNVEWRFEEGSYRRYQNGEVFEVLAEEEGSPEPLTADTVVVLLAAQRSAGYTDSAGAEVPTFDIVGFGRLLVAHGGQVVEGQWLRGAQADPWQFVTASGEPLRLPEGRVALVIVPRDLEVAATP